MRMIDDVNGNSSSPGVGRRRRHRIRLRKPEKKLTFGVYTDCSAPFYVTEIEPWEREERCRFMGGEIVMDGRYHYVRGSLSVPYGNGRGHIRWEVWVEIRPDNAAGSSKFERGAHPIGNAPLEGRLSSAIPGYPDTLTLAVSVHCQGRGSLPEVRIHDMEHLLGREQREGVTFQRWLELRPLHAEYHRYTDAK
ncbi:DUF2199 domain-containing protein [Paenibacillus thiaminolyticus]|uniref:DUF2199 domain-containing protein n=1 Tax=Paenibacillus thiaminolyticus TaxID=49283 RepID=A0A3A3GR13_PANTH|nr:DUF2199 domain-containing protein [Paenibacillus thiaminolyticus]RJG16060.1 DUF2199 domain-containing protein [Paenibacillus thiaminolyticus]